MREGAESRSGREKFSHFSSPLGRSTRSEVRETGEVGSYQGLKTPGDRALSAPLPHDGVVVQTIRDHVSDFVNGLQIVFVNFDVTRSSVLDGLV